VNLEGHTENERPLEGTGNTSLDHDEVLVDDTATESNKSWRVSTKLISLIERELPRRTSGAILPEG
jgi:hypothetical protein